MIQANELRIDNVFYFAGGVATISGIFDLTQVWVAFEKKELKINLKKLNPIPLTPEILGSAGLKKWASGEYSIQIDEYICFQVLEDGRYGFWSDSEENESNFTVISQDNRIHYLHELQNLYFSLTGQELTINLHATA